MTTPRRPPGRYDEPRAPLPRPALIAGAGVLGLLLLALTFAVFKSFTEGKARAGVLSFEVVDDRTVEVRFEVRKDPETSAYCRVRARNRDGAEVGAQEVLVGPSRGDRVVVVHRLVTTGRPSTGEVDGCRSAPRTPVDPSPSTGSP